MIEWTSSLDQADLDAGQKKLKHRTRDTASLKTYQTTEHDSCSAREHGRLQLSRINGCMLAMQSNAGGVGT